MHATIASPLMAGPLMAGPLMAGPLMAGPLMAGPLMAGPLMAGPLMAGALMHLLAERERERTAVLPRNCAYFTEIDKMVPTPTWQRDKWFAPPPMLELVDELSCYVGMKLQQPFPGLWKCIFFLDSFIYRRPI